MDLCSPYTNEIQLISVVYDYTFSAQTPPGNQDKNERQNLIWTAHLIRYPSNHSRGFTIHQTTEASITHIQFLFLFYIVSLFRGHQLIESHCIYYREVVIFLFPTTYAASVIETAQLAYTFALWINNGSSKINITTP
jgi:hypothetical protein